MIRIIIQIPITAVIKIDLLIFFLLLISVLRIKSVVYDY